MCRPLITMFDLQLENLSARSGYSGLLCDHPYTASHTWPRRLFARTAETELRVCYGR